MSGKGLNLFEECAAECVNSVTSGGIMYLFAIRGQQNGHIWHHSKFTEDANKNGGIAKVSVFERI